MEALEVGRRATPENLVEEGRVISLRVRNDEYERLRALAFKEQRTVSGQLRWLISAFLQQHPLAVTPPRRKVG